MYRAESTAACRKMTEDEAALWTRIKADPLPMSEDLPPGGRIGIDDSITLAGLLSRDTPLRPAQLERAMLEYRRFLMILARPGEGSVWPTITYGTVAQIARRHRADPVAWAHSCQTLLGGAPEANPEHLTWSHLPAYSETLARYRQLFGETPHPKIWPSVRRVHLMKVLGLLVGLAVLSMVIGMANLFQLQGQSADGRFAAGPSALVLLFGGITVVFLAILSRAIIGPWAVERSKDDGGGGSDGGD